MWSADKSMQGGGGFLDQTYNGDAAQTDKGPVRGNSIVPLMIGHLLQGNADSLNLWGTPIKLVQVVAAVRKCERLTTKISYDLVDETGHVMAFQWIDDNDNNLITVPEGSHAKIIGSLREQGDSRHIFILNIKPVNLFADIFEHLLEVTYACMKGKELYAEPTLGEMGGNQLEEMENNGCHGMDREQALVFKVIKDSNETESGIERGQIKKKVPADIRGQVDEILDFLVCEGHIYTTCTDDNFKTT